jgi:transcriptional regulator with XRE-family HTH domain
LDYSKIGFSLRSERIDRMDKSIYSREYEIFLHQLRAARRDAGLTQEQLAERVGQTQSFISKCERGERRLDIVEVRAFCAAIGISFPRFVAAFDRKLASAD